MSAPGPGFVTGWAYWFTWVVTGMAELTAIGIYTHYWFPSIPQWVPALATLAVLLGVNLIAVKVFGELEFWFALIKVVTIVATLVLGVAIITTGWGPLGQTANFANLWSHGGFAPMGVVGVVFTLQIACFAYAGVELIGVTAGEAESPEKVLPRATNSIVYRILIFYVGALVVIMSLVSWNELSPDMSPFVHVFDKLSTTACTRPAPTAAGRCPGSSSWPETRPASPADACRSWRGAPPRSGREMISSDQALSIHELLSH